MRHKNSISQVNVERDKEIIKLYKAAQSLAGSPTTIDRICQIAANLPATKFYISDYWAYRYVRERLNGNTKFFKDHRKRTLYNALYDTFKRQLHRKENQGKSIESIVYISLEQPAPFIGLAPVTLHKYIRQRLNIYQYETKKNEEIH
ncbi:MAG: hypothetical protein IKX17_05185 [Prevotella sp.]|nr:hypothetical protein [Prevotella sp.]